MYRLNIDTGGTFTDCLASTPQGEVLRRKVLSNSSLRAHVVKVVSASEIEISSNWGVSADLFIGYKFCLPGLPVEPAMITRFDPLTKRISLDSDLAIDSIKEEALIEITAHEEAPVLCARLITGTPLDRPLPEMEIRLGSTKGTNALLEHKGARTAMLVTRGFKDILAIGNQQRPDIFSREVEKPPPLAELILEVDERLDAKGKVVQPLYPAALRKAVRHLKKNGIQTVGVAFMHAWCNPAHEELAGEIIAEEGMEFLSVSSRLSGQIKYLLRAQTTEVNAYLSPLINQYIRQISSKIQGTRFLVMTSAGGLVKATSFLPKESLLSGPAGGVVGAVTMGREAGFSSLISFDMGGTSTDVARYDQKLEYCFEHRVGSASIHSPALSIETVAAGGGSICSYDGYKLVVGPDSAGAFPGPACYGAGGPLCITDVNLLSGHMDPAQFNIPVYPEAARLRLLEIQEAIQERSGSRPEEMELLQGFLRIANETMAAAIKKISTRKGVDPSRYALLAFGGAGGMHACSIAGLLNMARILIPDNAGLLSAYGISEALMERFAERQVLKPLDGSVSLDDLLSELEEEARNKLLKEGVPAGDVIIRTRLLFLRFLGQESSMEVSWKSQAQLISDFRTAYEQVYGHWSENRVVELESVRVVASVRQKKTEIPFKKPLGKEIQSESQNSLGIPLFSRNRMKPGDLVWGPAIVLDPFSTTFVEEGWSCVLDQKRTLLLSREKAASGTQEALTPEAELELFSRRFMGIAENMGAMLQHTSVSVNVKERLDFSCAIVDSQGYLVANAPHIPVHLGGLGICVRSLLDHFELNPGDTLVTNHPAFGGSHLPDITLVSPVYTQKGEGLGFVVNRAHHAEIGGISPGSMPPHARSLAEEGVVIPPFYLKKSGEVDWKGMEEIFTQSPFPTRALAENLADLNGALAANRRGAAELLALADQYGADQVIRFMELLRIHAANKTEEALKAYPLQKGYALEYLDDQTPLAVKISRSSRGFKLDFSGSGGVHPGNLNANPAIVHSVIMYVLRLLLNEELPLNDGMLDPIEICLPEGLLNPPFPDDPFKCPALVGGNVEISQRLTDTLLKALELQAASQGTMNNLLFGNQQFGYYETICGGCGAGPGFHGADAVHHHMTNTRITDPEIMEHRYPVRLVRFQVRKDSGGSGAYNGGSGVIREILFLQEVELSLLTQRRSSGPYGMHGGGDGKPGVQCLIRSNGELLPLESVSSARVYPNDRLLIQTPGGGAWGTKS